MTAAARALGCDSCLIDGEVIVQDADGRSDFAGLKPAIRAAPDRLIFMAFDILHLDGRDLRKAPLIDRRGALEQLLGSADSEQLHFSHCVQGNGRQFFEAVDAMGLEGIVSKKLNSRYRSGPAPAWLKTKTFICSELVVIGVERGDRAPVALLAWEREGELVYAGGAMITLRTGDRDRFWEQVEGLKVKRPAAAMDKKLKEGSWVKPSIRLRVKHLRREEKLRHATVVGML